jgi:hypothetical protein
MAQTSTQISTATRRKAGRVLDFREEFKKWGPGSEKLVQCSQLKIRKQAFLLLKMLYYSIIPEA